MLNQYALYVSQTRQSLGPFTCPLRGLFEAKVDKAEAKVLKSQLSTVERISVVDVSTGGVLIANAVVESVEERSGLVSVKLTDGDGL